jgi:hypothetical protein
MKKFLEKRLHIYAHEAPSFLWISAVFFTIFFVTAIFRNYVDTAFLKRYGPSYIPWMLVINALLTFVIMGLADRLALKFSDSTLLTGFLAIYAGACFGLFFMVKAGVSLAYPILYQLLYLLDTLLLVYLWNMAGDLFDARQGKRVFPMITAAQVLGTTLGSFATKPAAKLLGGEDPTLILFAVSCFAVAVFLARTGKRRMGKTGPTQKSGQKAPPRRPLTEVPALMKRYPIIRYLIVTGLVPNILLPIFFYQFSVIANATFHSEQALMSFLSIFRGMTTFTTFIILLFMGRFYSVIGLTNASLVQPLNFAFLFATLTGFFNIFVAAYGQFSSILIQRAVAGPVNKILYSIVPSELMLWSRSFIRGTVLKVGMLSGSLLMIFLKPVLDARLLSPIALVLALYLVAETLLLRKHYKRILKQVIVEKEIDFDQIDAVRTFDSGGGAMEIGPVSVEDRSEEKPFDEEAAVGAEVMPPDIALRLLSDPNPLTRADAALSFAVTKDSRAVRPLIALLNETDDRVRNAAIDALIAYREQILPFLEVSLVEAKPRMMQGILEVIRLSGVKDFEMIPFLGKQLTLCYGNLIALRRLREMPRSLRAKMLEECLEEVNSELLRVIFYALWVNHADMRLMYRALQSESASIAVEMVETTINKEITPYLVPLIEDAPIDEKIEKGRKLLPLIRNDNPERLLTVLSESEDSLTRLLTLYFIADDMPLPTFVPVLEARMEDGDPHVREMARYALGKIRNEVVYVPEVINVVNRLKDFSIFEGMGIRELHAIASVTKIERFAQGDVMIREGEENSSIYLLVRGKVGIYSAHGSSDERLKATIGAGSFLGELSLFTRLPPNATCVAVEEADAYVLRHHQFVEIMKVYPQIGINLCRFFSAKLRQASY